MTPQTVLGGHPYTMLVIKSLPVFKHLNIACGRNTRLLLVQMLFCLCLCAAVSGCLSCTEILWDFKANLDVQDGVSSIEHNTK